MADSDIEDASPLFIYKEWIGIGQKLPEINNIPLGLANYFHGLKDIVSTVKKLQYPPEHLNIEQFIGIKLPCCTYSLPEVHIQQCLSTCKLNQMDEWMMNHMLPPWQLVKKLNKHFCQAVLDGMQSVIDPAYPGSHLPLWSI
jgi:hypothetical protein